MTKLQINPKKVLQNRINKPKMCQRTNLSLPQTHSVAVTFNNGRLGNQMSSFASLYSVWREFGINYFITIPNWKKLNEVFDLPMSNDNLENIAWPFYILSEGMKIKDIFS